MNASDEKLEKEMREIFKDNEELIFKSALEHIVFGYSETLKS